MQSNKKTVDEARAVYNLLCEAKRRSKVKEKHARQEQEKLQAAMVTFLDDLQEATGLPLNSPLFASIAILTLVKRAAQKRDSLVEDSFPNGW